MTTGGPNRRDLEDRRFASWSMIAIVAAVIVAGAVLVLVVGPMFAAELEPGLGMGQAALIAFAVTLILFVVMALAAGDGLIGEFQYMIGGFGAFFVVLWVLIAWIF